MQQQLARSQGRNQYQRGFLLESLGLVLLILSVLALAQMNRKFEEDLDNEATRRGQALKTVRNVASNYLIVYSPQLLALNNMSEPMDVTTGAGEPFTIGMGGSPTIPELRELGITPPNLSPKAPGGGNYVIRITKVPTGQADPASNLEGLVTVDEPYLNDGKPDYARLGIAAGVVGSDGAFSTRANPQRLSGYGGAWSTINPVTNQPGILAARFGYASSIYSVFYRRDGSTPLTGSLAGGGQEINDVTRINASGKVTGENFISTFFNLNDPCIAEDENAFASGVSGAMMVCKNGGWRYAKYNPASPGATCSPDGAIGTSISAGAMEGTTLICKKGKYINLNNLIAKHVEVARLRVENGQHVPQPACEAGGTADYSLWLSSTVVDMSLAAPREAFEALATPTPDGTAWLVSVELIDTDHHRFPAPDGMYAMMNLECKY